MSNELTQSAQYCSDLVKSRDEDRWLAARYANGAGQRKLLALYAFHVELTRIPAAVSEPPLGEIRLQWWREAFDEIRTGKEPRAHPVVQEIAQNNWADPDYARHIDQAIDAGARMLYGEGFRDADDLANWFSQAEGYVDVCAFQCLGGSDASDIRDAGVALALAREGRGIAPTLIEEIEPLASRKYLGVKSALRKIEADIAPAVLHLSLTPSYLHHGPQPFPVKKRAKIFAAMAAGLF